MSAVFISHPHVQHSFQLAWAMEEAGLLERLVTSVSLGARQFDRLPLTVRRIAARRVAYGIPASKITNFPSYEAGWRLMRPFVTSKLRERLLYLSMEGFDARAAGELANSKAELVVCYENAALATFSRAKELGKTTVLDAASVHFEAQRQGLDTKGAANVLPRVEQRKAREIELADHIVTLSTFAKETYAAAGYPENRIHTLPLGVDGSTFGSRPADVRKSGFTYLFVGNQSHAKGIDLLLEAFKAVAVPEKRLVLVGRATESALKTDVEARVEVRGYLTGADLVRAYWEADVFVFPSRLDGLGQVVLEAMAAGLPVIVSTRAGARDFVIDGKSGWWFPSGDVLNLANRMQDAFHMRERLKEMGQLGRKLAGLQTWAEYRHKARQLYAGLAREHLGC